MTQLKRYLILASLAASSLCNGAMAAYLDFTDSNTISSLSLNSNVYSGSIDGIGFTLTSDIGAVNFNESYDGSLRNGCQSNGGPLKCDLDGAGINNDEITGLSASSGQTMILEFASAVSLSGFDFLDLYVNPNDQNRREQATVRIGGATYNVAASESSGQGGHENLDLLALGGPVIGTTIFFSANSSPIFWDDTTNDYALAGVEVSAIPIPAAVWLFGTALIGLFGFSKRRKTV